MYVVKVNWRKTCADLTLGATVFSKRFHGSGDSVLECVQTYAWIIEPVQFGNKCLRAGELQQILQT